MYVGVPNIFLNEMCVRRMYRVRNSNRIYTDFFRNEISYNGEDEIAHFNTSKDLTSVLSLFSEFWGIYNKNSRPAVELFSINLVIH